jgi:hypothetical protein
MLIPASVRKIDGCAFMKTGIRSIAVACSPHFRTDGYFLIDSAGGIVRYFGDEANLTVPMGIVALRRECFSHCTTLCKVVFEPGSALAEIAENAFSGCTNLELVDIPASIQIIHGSAFVNASFAGISLGYRSPLNPNSGMLEPKMPKSPRKWNILSSYLPKLNAG